MRAVLWNSNFRKTESARSYKVLPAARTVAGFEKIRRILKEDMEQYKEMLASAKPSQATFIH